MVVNKSGELYSRRLNSRIALVEASDGFFCATLPLHKNVVGNEQATFAQARHRQFEDAGVVFFVYIVEDDVVFNLSLRKEIRGRHRCAA